FSRLLVNGTMSAEFQYVRDVTVNETHIDDDEFGKIYPLFGNEIYTTNFTCGRDAIKSAAKTETATVVAGEEVGNGRYNNTIFHDGPAQVFMSEASSSDLEAYAGYQGDCFKIAEWLAKNATKWIIDDDSGRQKITDLNFTIPSSTPPGKYLLRVEQWSYSPYLQFYVNCAQIDLVGPGGGNPIGFAKFPGSYDYKAIDSGKLFAKF
ncbi:lytic polysaccharide monooxygenase, partial [Melanomma pulvis-pyrius CBS 109.77]